MLVLSSYSFSVVLDPRPEYANTQRMFLLNSIKLGKILSFGDTNMRTRFTCGAREFVNRWSECGPTHHFAAATGRHIDTILKVAKIFNVPVDIVTR